QRWSIRGASSSAGADGGWTGTGPHAVVLARHADSLSEAENWSAIQRGPLVRRADRAPRAGRSNWGRDACPGVAGGRYGQPVSASDALASSTSPFLVTTPARALLWDDSARWVYPKRAPRAPGLHSNSEVFTGRQGPHIILRLPVFSKDPDRLATTSVIG